MIFGLSLSIHTFQFLVVLVLEYCLCFCEMCELMLIYNLSGSPTCDSPTATDDASELCFSLSMLLSFLGCYLHIPGNEVDYFFL